MLAFFVLLIYCFRAKQSSPDGCIVDLDCVQVRQIRHRLCFKFSLRGMNISFLIDSCSSFRKCFAASVVPSNMVLS